jgi:tetratricopeptide (TPR) repeat protein
LIFQKFVLKMEEQTTQLADTRPLLDFPLRMVIPVNVPSRVSKPTLDEDLYAQVYSPFAQAQGYRHKLRQLFSDSHVMQSTAADKTTASSASLKNNKNSSNASSSLPLGGNMEHDAQLKNLLKDFNLLAFSSKRAEKKDVEATAYASLGVLCDNQDDFYGAIDQYELYLKLCEELGDEMGVSAACNCMGVDYMFLASKAKLEGSDDLDSSLKGSNNLDSNNISSKFSSSVNTGGGHSSPAKKSTGVRKNTKRSLLQQAIIAHSRHLDVSPDIGGKLVAHINLGICLSWLGDIAQAAKNFQDALRVAIKMQTLYGQSIAVGNLGLLALGKRDFHTARTCFDQHLQLIQALLDPEAEISAWKLVSWFICGAYLLLLMYCVDTPLTVGRTK